MRKFFFFFLLTSLFGGIGFARQMSVQSFRCLETDMDARINYPQKDNNGKKCAIIKEVTAEKVFSDSASNKQFTVNGVIFTMVYVSGGTFTMGATAGQGSDAESYEKSAHQVTLDSYYIGETEVTQALWQAVMDSIPSRFKGDNLPVENVSWKDCQEFVAQLNNEQSTIRPKIQFAHRGRVGVCRPWRQPQPRLQVQRQQQYI